MFRCKVPIQIKFSSTLMRDHRRKLIELKRKSTNLEGDRLLNEITEIEKELDMRGYIVGFTVPVSMNKREKQ